MSDWIKKRRREEYYRRSKRENYRSRAAYKLIQLNKKYNLLKNVKVVIDVCSAPGGWIQAIRSEVGDSVYILGIDKNKLSPLKGNTELIQGDIVNKEIIEEIAKKIPDKADVVVSDCSMKTIGASNVDVERQNFLVSCVFENIAIPFLKKGGHFLAKIFQGRNINDIKRDFQKYFKFVKFTKPKASVKSSREIYLVCKNFI